MGEWFPGRKHMTYKTLITTTDTLSSENHGELIVESESDSLGMTTFRFGNSFTLRLDEDQIDNLRSILYDVSRRAAIRRTAEEGV